MSEDSPNTFYTRSESKKETNTMMTNEELQEAIRFIGNHLSGEKNDKWNKYLSALLDIQLERAREKENPDLITIDKLHAKENKETKQHDIPCDIVSCDTLLTRTYTNGQVSPNPITVTTHRIDLSQEEETEYDKLCKQKGKLVICKHHKKCDAKKCEHKTRHIHIQDNYNNYCDVQKQDCYFMDEDAICIPFTEDKEEKKEDYVICHNHKDCGVVCCHKYKHIHKLQEDGKNFCDTIIVSCSCTTKAICIPYKEPQQVTTQPK